MAKRQTIWLSTMMVLSLMLIGFYTVNNNVQEVSTTDTAKTQSNPLTSDQAKDSAAPSESSDYFIGYHLENNQKISKKTEELQNVIATGNSAADIDKAKKELDQLNAEQDMIDNVTGLLFKEGYPDAIIEKKDDKINVTVQAQQLDKKNAVKIMDLVAKEMNVPSRMVIVANHE